MNLNRLIEKDILADVTSTEAGTSEIVDLNFADRFSCQAVYDVQTPSAKTFDSGKKAVLTNQSVTYTAVTAGTAGNSITIRLIDPGVDGALSIAVVGTAITATLAYATGAVTTTATQLVAAVNANVDAAALVLASGSGASPLTALSATPLATGANSEVNLTDNTVTIPNNGYTTGFKVQLTTTGTLPSPLALATDYFLIVVDDNTVKFATSLANALAGTAIDITDVGSDGAVNTVTGVALAGAQIEFFASNDENGTWTSLQSATSIAADGSVLLVQPNVAYRYFKVVKSLTSGQVDVKALVLVKGGY